MIISARVHYAAIALAELAARYGDSQPVSIREITDRHGVPGPFLVQILRTIRSAGYVESTRGSQGGYRLAVDPAELTLLDVVDAMGAQENVFHTEAAENTADETLQEIWRQAEQASRSVLAAHRIVDLAEKVQHGDSSMFYI